MKLLLFLGAWLLSHSLVPLADPYILLYDGTYYAYGTSSDRGILVYSSNDLKKWTNDGLALDKDDSYADRKFWAPEVYHLNGQFYMFYSADEHVCVATSSSPEGPFRQDVQAPLREEKGIDNSLFVDDDGTPYMFFVRFTDGNAIWVAEMNKDLKSLKENTLHPCIHVSQQWEKDMGRVNEGPFVIKHDGLYYMTYSANDFRSRNYGIGCATATDIMGEWTKYPENPLLQKPDTLVGVGHHSLFTDKKGNLRIVFHAHRNHEKVQPRCMYISTAGFEEVDGVDRLRISAKKILVPRLR
jgi:beta-xylosidase